MFCTCVFGPVERAFGTVAALCAALVFSGMPAPSASAQTFPKPKPFAASEKPRKPPEKRDTRSRKPSLDREAAKPSAADGGPQKSDGLPSAPPPAPVPAAKTAEPNAGAKDATPVEPRPQAAGAGHKGRVAVMRVQIPADAWNDATRAALFSRGRLIDLEEFPALGTRLKADGASSAAATAPAPSAQAPLAADSAPAAIGGVTDTPLPRRKDGVPDVSTLPEAFPDDRPDPDCEGLEAAGVIGELVKPIEITPAGCGIPHPVNVTAIKTSAGAVKLEPAGAMRCAAARAIADWVKDDMVPLAKEKLGKDIRAVQTASSYVCRPRNHVSGAQLSEHGRGTALDVAGFTFSDGTAIVIGQTADDKGFSQAVRLAACKHLTTVLGPGTDAEHGNHLHVDLKIRPGGYRICQ